MRQEPINLVDCSHNYIICLGDKEAYCLICGEKVLEMPYNAICIDADLYRENYPIETEKQRKEKIRRIKNDFIVMLMESTKLQPEEIIYPFKEQVEQKRNHKFKIKSLDA